MKNGFTLVELSIVLVIIGLLIGGILVGQSLIDSAKINQAVRQIQQYDIAVSNFQEKFRQLPGDSNLFTLAGNNDGDLADNISGAGIPECGLDTCLEGYGFWKHLTDSGTLKGSYSNDFTNGSEIDINSPDFLGSHISAEYSAEDIGDWTKGWQYQSEADGNEITMLSLDIKLDDGNRMTGNVRYDDPGADEWFTSISMLATIGDPLNN